MTEVAIQSLTKAFGAARAVDSISLLIRDGEFVSLLGPSGCGKTTTLKLVAGFEEADQGAILFDGRDVGRLPAEKRDIGMVFQNYALFPHMDVAQNLSFGLEMRRVPKPARDERIARALDMVQLKGFAGRYPRQLSGGQQQRVALARALVIEPRILLLDEPLANLDAKLREEMRVFIRDIQRRVGITTVYVTHDQAEAMTMSDRVVVMFGGRIAQVGAPAEIYERPVNLEVARFVGQVNIVEGRVLARDGGACRVATPLGAIESPGCAEATEGAVVNVALRPESITLHAEGGPGWPGRVSAVYYSGSVVDYRIALDAGPVLHVQAFPGHRYTEGERVAAHAAPERFWVVGGGAA